jgi:guanylate kinase
MNGNLIIISSPSGGGKGTLIREVLESVPCLGYSVSHTTRSPRFGEEHGHHYHFVSKQKFEDEVQAGEFLEYAEVHGNMYGTSLASVEKITSAGNDVILEIDVQGAMAVMKKVPEVVSVFILPPSFEVLRARLEARGTESSEDLQLRLKNAVGEVMHYSWFKYVIVNDEIFSAARKLANVILGERQRRDRQKEVIRGIVDSFGIQNPDYTGE